MVKPAIISASLIAACSELIVFAISTTMPFCNPWEGDFPIPIISFDHPFFALLKHKF